MTPEQLDRLFQPFTQADASITRRFGGTGLGLVITQRFCELMGGKLSVESALGQGSVFTMVLPAGVSRQPDASPERTDATAKRRTIVLVIDDDPSVHDLLRRFHDLYNDGDIPDLSAPFSVDLFNTYRAALFPRHHPIRATDHQARRQTQAQG